MKPAIYVCGKQSVGKSSLIRTVIQTSLGSQQLYTSSGNELYETPVVDFIEANSTFADTVPVQNEVQAVWFCLDGGTSALSQEEGDFIKSLDSRALVVVTKSELMNEDQTKSMMDALMNLVSREQIVLVSESKKSGLPCLINKTKQIIENTSRGLSPRILSYSYEREWDNYFSRRLHLWSQKNEEEANSYITWAAGRAAAIAVVPLPLADVTPLVANEIYMIYKLAGVYGIANDQSIISMILGCTGGSLVGKIGASFLPFLKIPIAAAVTYGVGKAAKAFFESGMELNGDTLLEIFEKAKDEASSLFW